MDDVVHARRVHPKTDEVIQKNSLMTDDTSLHQCIQNVALQQLNPAEGKGGRGGEEAEED